MIAFKNGNFLFTFLDDSKTTLQIGNGTYIYHNACETCPSKLIIPSLANYDGTYYKLTIISTKAFLNCETTSYVFIPKTIEIIKFNAFNSVPAEFYFEQGSNLKEIETAGLGWIRTKNLVLPPSIEILHNGSLRGFDFVKHLFYCGTSIFDNIEIFNTSDPILKIPIIHVTNQFKSDHFGNGKVNQNNLNCNIPFIYTNFCDKKSILNASIQLIFLIML